MRLALIIGAAVLGTAALVLAIEATLRGQWLLACGDLLVVACNLAVLEVNRRAYRREVRS